MTDEVSKTPGPFDVERIRSLVVLMRRHDLSEIDLHDGAMRIRLRRGRPAGQVVTSVAPVAPQPHVPPPATSVPRQTADAEPAAAGKKLVEIKAPTPGTFYAKSSPEAEPYVRVGTRVAPSTVVCLIEAMKLFNEIAAECSGVIAEILVENQQAVEYGQVLFRVDPTA